MQFDGVGDFFRRGFLGIIFKEEHIGAQEIALLVYFQNFETLTAFGDDVHATVVIFFGYRHNLRRAADFSDPAFLGPDDAKLFLLRETFADHFFVAGLEDVQGQRHAGQQNHFQGEQGEKRTHKASEQVHRRKRERESVQIVRQHLTSHWAEEYKLDMELAGKVVVVTGGSMGIGEAIAKLFADHGANLVLLSRDAGRAEAARGRIGYTERTLALSCDVRHREELDRVLSLTLHHFDRIDVWINNAGQGLRDSLAQMDMAACHDMFEANFFGAVAAMQAVIPVMKQQGSGTIVNISSVAGHIPVPFIAAYCASKFALNAIGKAAAVELKNSGIHVMTVCPGYVQTDFSANAIKGREARNVRSASDRGITAQRVARAVLDGYAKQKREVIVPWTLHPVIKLYQLFPAVVEWGMAKRIGNGRAEAQKVQRSAG
jgi:short-subunit dehydrogenase